MLAVDPVAASFDAGSHGSTFGGNALASAVAVAVLQTLEKDDLLAHCRAMGDRLREGLRDVAAQTAVIREVRGRGLLLGAVLEQPAGPVVDACRERGLIINCTANTVLRFAPPLTVRPAEIDAALEIVREVLVK
jgi:acetylornithine/succinyldiaminopimelate/putrescine aminotransferase